MGSQGVRYKRATEQQQHKILPAEIMVPGSGRSGLLLLREQNKQTRFYSVKTENMALWNEELSTNHNSQTGPGSNVFVFVFKNKKES